MSDKGDAKRRHRLMPKPNATFTQAELRRYLKVIREAGYDQAQVEIDKSPARFASSLVRLTKPLARMTSTP